MTTLDAMDYRKNLETITVKDVSKKLSCASYLMKN